jgi:hypothetical protein
MHGKEARAIGAKVMMFLLYPGRKNEFANDACNLK